MASQNNDANIAEGRPTAPGPSEPWALGPFGIVRDVMGVLLAITTGLRVVLLTVYCQLGSLTTIELVRVFAAGARADALVAAVSVLPVLLLAAIAGSRRTARFQRGLLEASWSVVLASMPLLCVIEYLFFEEFDSRLNYIAFEYLVYPTEVCCNIQQSYPVGWLVCGVVLSGAGLCFSLRKRLLRQLATPLTPRLRWSFPAAFGTLTAVLFATTNGSQSDVTSNRVANECAMNGVASFVNHAWTCRFEFDRLYLTLERQDAHKRVRNRVAAPDDEFLEAAAHPLDRRVRGRMPQKNYNVVVILEESLGSDHVGAVGGARLTPEFDALCREGLLFDNFFATGNRTARALEAVLTSLPPIPTESILKRDHSSHVHSLANVLGERGYERLFLTGGRGSFDGVRHFMRSNGFNHFREQDDFDRPVFANAWGVSDEDLFRKGLAEMDSLSAAGKPFFSMLLTVSNHRPFTFPSGRVEPAPTNSGRDNVVKYADWALGEFFRSAKTRPWYAETVFVVMGDHGARVYGKQIFPLRSYRVPVLMILPEGERAGTRCHTLGCSLDIAPTILGILGGDYASVFFGRDLNRVAPESGYALMQHNHSVALLDAGNHLTVLSSGKRVELYEVHSRKFKLQPVPLPNRVDLDVAAMFQTAYEMYYGELCSPAARESNDPSRGIIQFASDPTARPSVDAR